MGGEGPGREAKEEISDRVRAMCEQCDGLQGMHSGAIQQLLHAASYYSNALYINL